MNYLNIAALIVVSLAGTQAVTTTWTFSWADAGVLQVQMKTDQGYTSKVQTWTNYSDGSKVCSSDGIWCVATQAPSTGSTDQTLWYANTYRYDSCKPQLQIGGNFCTDYICVDNEYFECVDQFVW